MKKTIISLFIAIVSLATFAQTGVEQISIDDLPTGGTVDEAVSKLKAKGCTLLANSDKRTALIGNFMEYQNCVIGIIPTPQQSIKTIIAMIPSETWQSLTSAYSTIKKEATERYGTPTACTEMINVAPIPQDDEGKLAALQSGNCQYYTFYEKENDTIAVSLTHLEEKGNYATFTYMCSQESMEHLTFMGIPIDGTQKEFTEKLKTKGFSYDSDTDTFHGTFARYSGCKIHLLLSKTKDVKSVGVCFPNDDTWPSLYSKYSSLKSMLTQKYGKPLSCTEKFQIDVEGLGNDIKIHLLKNDECEYNTIFHTPCGVISIFIAHIKSNYKDYCYVSLLYSDKINNSKDESDAMDDL